MKALGILIATLLGLSLSARADSATEPTLMCRGQNGAEVTEVRLWAETNRLYRADISVYNKLSHVPFPPPVLKSYLEVGLWKHVFRSPDDEFHLLEAGSQSHLRTDTIDLDVNCAYAAGMRDFAGKAQVVGTGVGLPDRGYNDCFIPDEVNAVVERAEALADADGAQKCPGGKARRSGDYRTSVNCVHFPFASYIVNVKSDATYDCDGSDGIPTTLSGA